MKYNLVEEENWRRKLEVTIPEEDINKKFEEVYKVLKREAQIPGFRKGKAPINVIKSRYGKLAEKEVLESVVPDAYSEAVKESGVMPISDPAFSMIQIEEGKPVTFTAEFDIKPEIELQKYTGFTLKKQSPELREEDVEDAYKHILDRFSSLKTKEGAAEDNDLVVVDMEVLEDPSNSIEQKEMKDFQFQLNQKATLPEFYNALKGINPGDVREVEIDYPDDYYQEQMAGKHFKFKLTAKEIKEVIPPEINEEFLKQFGEDMKTADDLKDRIREDLKQRRQQEVENELQDQTIKSVISANTFELPESLIHNYLDHMVEDYKQQNQDKQADDEELRKQYRPMAIRFIRWNLLYHLIAEKEKIEVSKEDTDNWLENFADKSNITVEQAREFLAAQKKIQDVKETILEQKVIDFILESSTVEDV
jgi:trigger factor